MKKINKINKTLHFTHQTKAKGKEREEQEIASISQFHSNNRRKNPKFSTPFPLQFHSPTIYLLSSISHSKVHLFNLFFLHSFYYKKIIIKIQFLYFSHHTHLSFRLLNFILTLLIAYWYDNLKWVALFLLIQVRFWYDFILIICFIL